MRQGAECPPDLYKTLTDFSDVTERKIAEEALTNMGRKLIEAHEDERTWIGRELHDDINQRIALLSIELDRWSQSAGSSSDIHYDPKASVRVL